jgi:serine/threonine-protein kinase
MSSECPKCHSNNPDTQRFCGECGTQLPSPEEISASQTKTLETPVQELARGTTFADRYEFMEELGRGGMGRVYKVFDKKIQKKIDRIKKK